jgi:hypothetical protein
MGDVLKFKRRKPGDKHQGKSLCQHGHHKWQAAEQTPFDVKQGKLVTRYICVRCGATKFQAS